jgi:hypothetical protein
MKIILTGIGIYIITWITLMIFLRAINIGTTDNSIQGSIDAIGHTIVILFTVIVTIQLVIIKEIRNIKDKKETKED